MILSHTSFVHKSTISIANHNYVGILYHSGGGVLLNLNESIYEIDLVVDIPRGI